MSNATRGSLMFLAACLTAAHASAGTITVTSTLAQAAAINCYATGPTFATCSESHSYGSAASVADAGAGHLGAYLGASAPGYVNGFAQFLMGLDLNGFTDADFLEIDMSLKGTFSAGGATASLYFDTGDSFSANSISCGSGILQTTGSPCTVDGVQQDIFSLANLDHVGLTFLLQPALTYAPTFADFLHSMDFTIKVPNGTTIVNNPGGTLFQGSVASVPEPAPALLIGSCLIAISPWRRILRRRGCKKN